MCEIHKGAADKQFSVVTLTTVYHGKILQDKKMLDGVMGLK